MTKSSTLEAVLSKSYSARNNRHTPLHIPSRETVTTILRYSMALQVVKTQISGNICLILN